MDEVLQEISDFVNQCLSFLGKQPSMATEVSDLESNLISIGMQLASTFVLFLFVYFFLWKKITRLIEARQEKALSELKGAQEAKERALKLVLEKDAEYQTAKEEARRLINEAVKEGNIQKDKIIEDAKEEARRRLNNADEEIKLEIEKSKKEIKDAIVDVAFAAAEKIVKKEIDRDKHHDIVKEFIKEVGK